MVSEIKFEEFLQKEFMKEEPQILDDDLPDAFDGWVANLDISECIEYADKWMEEFKKETRKNFDMLTEENPERIKEMLGNYASQEKERWVREMKKGIEENKSKWAREGVWKEAYRAGWNNASDEIINLLQK